MGDVHPIPTTPGLASGLVGQDLEIGRSVGASRVERLFVRRTDNGSGDVLTAEIRNAGGSTLSVTIADGEQSNLALGVVEFAADEPILFRVTASGLTSQNVGGSIDVFGSGGATTYLTSLALVKSWLGITDSAKDQILTEILPGRSLAIEHYMRRQIIEAAYTAERHRIDFGYPLAHRINLREWPVSAVAEVREGTAVLDPSRYRVLSGGILERAGDSADAGRPWSGPYVEVDYTAGYASIPADLVVAATAEVAHAYRQSEPGGGRLGKTGSIFTGQTDAAFVPWDFLPESRRVFDFYARKV